MEESDASVAVPELSQQLIGIPFSSDTSARTVVVDPSSKFDKAVNLNGEAIDFIGSTDAIKALWSIPHAQDDTDISIVIHNVGGTLLVDTSIVNPPTAKEDNSNSEEPLVDSIDSSSQLTTVGISASQSDLILSYLANPDCQLRRLEYELNLVPTSTHPQDPVGDDRPMHSSSAVIIVLDAYLDTIIANVPQLALCLQDKGFIQTSQFFTHPSNSHSHSHVDPLFSPDIIETNASMLLNFLKYHCSQDHSTYLLRKQVGETTLQLYDVSALSRQRKQQWLWWLAMTSYRFALRLKQFSKGMSNKENSSTLRMLRTRQRNLLRNSLELLEEHVDMGGKDHETITAALNECLADTYLVPNDDEIHDTAVDDKDVHHDSMGTKAIASVSLRASSKALLSSSLSSHESSTLLPYKSLRTDSLTKAQDYLITAIDSLNTLVERSESESTQSASVKNEFLSSQLYGLNCKLINVLLQVTVHYLKNYSSSSAMQSIRMAGRRISDTLHIIKLFGLTNVDKEKEYMINLFHQSLSLWEHCGLFARSYAADGLWRDRGHAGGDDIIALLQDVHSTMSALDLSLAQYSAEVAESACDFNLNNLTGIIESTNLVDEKDMGCLSLHAVSAAKQIMDKQKQIKREELRVLVAATHCFGRAICILETLERFGERTEVPVSKTNTLFRQSTLVQSTHIHQLHGDASNEVGKILLAKVKDLLLSPSDSRMLVHKAEDSAAPYAPLLLSAEIWFIQGLRQFQICKDKRNIAVIRCNLCQCSKLRANTTVALPRSGSCSSFKHENFSRDKHSELCLQDAINHLQLAHVALDQRETDAKTWDMVSEELAASYLILGVKRRQSILGGVSNAVIPKALRIQPGEERFIIEPMEQAITVYEQLGNQHQEAAAHYQLAIFYSKVWTSQINEGKTREKLQKAFRHFQLAHNYFFNHLYGNEPTFVILCLDLSQLYSSVSSEANCLIKALLCYVDTCNAFSTRINANRVSQPGSKQAEEDWNEKMKTLSKNMDDAVFSLLVNLVKLEKANDASGKPSVCFKDIYRKLLSLKMSSGNLSHNGDSEEFPVYKILLQLRDEMKPYIKDLQRQK